MFKKIKVLVLLILVSFPVLLTAQMGSKDMSYYDVSANIGTTVFLGDVSYRPFKFSKMDWRYAAGLSVGKRFSALLGGRGSLLIGQLAGKQKNDARSMEGNYFEITANGLLYLDNIFGEKRIDRFFQPYIVGGLGIIGYNTTRYSTDPEDEPKVVRSKVAGLALLGIGFNFHIVSQWSIGIETAQRGVFSDLVDSWSGHPYDKRKNDSPFDWYNTTSVNIIYRFGSSFRYRGEYFNKVTRRKLKNTF